MLIFIPIYFNSFILIIILRHLGALQQCGQFTCKCMMNKPRTCTRQGLQLRKPAAATPGTRGYALVKREITICLCG